MANASRGGLEKCHMRHQGLPTVSRNRGSIATSTFLRPTLGAPLFGLPELIPCSRRPGWIEFLKLSASYGGDVESFIQNCNCEDCEAVWVKGAFDMFDYTRLSHVDAAPFGMIDSRWDENALSQMLGMCVRPYHTWSMSKPALKKAWSSVDLKVSVSDCLCKWCKKSPLGDWQDVPLLLNAWHWGWRTSSGICRSWLLTKIARPHVHESLTLKQDCFGYLYFFYMYHWRNFAAPSGMRVYFAVETFALICGSLAQSPQSPASHWFFAPWTPSNPIRGLLEPQVVN